MKIERKENGETVVKSVAQSEAAKMVKKGWTVSDEPKPEKASPKKGKKAKS